MSDEEYILLQRVCEHYDVDHGFVESLHELELIRLKKMEDTYYLAHEELDHLEKLMRLHRDLNINIEGLGAVSQLLKKIKILQKEIEFLKKGIEK